MSQLLKLEIKDNLADKIKHWDWIIFALWAIVSIYSYYLHQRKVDLLFIVMSAIVVILRFLPKKVKPNYLEIYEEQIKWRYAKDGSETNIFWNELEWINFENDGISSYGKSSFNTFLNTTSFTKAQKEKLNLTVSGISMEKNIKLFY